MIIYCFNHKTENAENAETRRKAQKTAERRKTQKNAEKRRRTQKKRRNTQKTYDTSLNTPYPHQQYPKLAEHANHTTNP